MNIYSIDIKICATAYIKAASEAEAMKIAKEMEGDSFELPEGLEYLETPISGRQLNDPDLPDVSLSPAMTLHGPWDECTPELAEGDEPEVIEPEDQSQGDVLGHDDERPTP